MEIALDRINKMLEGHSLMLVSDRGPVEYALETDGQVRVSRGRGGLVTALNPVSRLENASWIASAKSEIERRIAKEADSRALLVPFPERNLKLRFVALPQEIYDRFYNVACNRLWFIQHHMWGGSFTGHEEPGFRHAWEEGYIPANKDFAEAVVQESRKMAVPPLIMVHDIHLYLTTGLIRHYLPDATIEHFVHIPWPAPGYWEQLPDYARDSILRGLLGADIVGLQTERDVGNFLDCCQTFLPKAHVHYEDREVTFASRTTHVNAYPASIDLGGLRGVASSPETTAHERRLLALSGKKTLVRVDRVEPTKNIPHGFRAFSILLEKHPELVGDVNFLAFLVPSPLDIPEYGRCQEDITHEVNAINARFGRADWQPVTVFYEHNYYQALAGLRLYDMLLVNSLADGMNLVSKEGPMVNTRNGVLVLSDRVGAYNQLKEGALPVSPEDVEMTAEALYEALTMSDQEREQRMMALRRAIEREDATRWFTRQLEDLIALH